MDKKKLFTFGAIGGMLLFFGLFIAPLIMKAALNIMGATAATVTTIALGMVVTALAPSFGIWVTALKYKTTKFVVDRAPIETLYTRLEERTNAVNKYRARLQEQTQVLKSYRRKALKMIDDYPEDAEVVKAELERFENLLVFRVERYKELTAQVEVFTNTVQKAERRYEMAVASMEAGKAMEMDDNFMNKLKEQFAFDKVEQTVDAAFAQMDMAMVDESMALEKLRAEGNTRRVKYTAGGDVDLGNILIPVARPVRAGAVSTQPDYMRGL